MNNQVVVEAPAKINLTLKVVAKRTDGYHELETVMQQINLCDQIFIDTADQGIIVNSNSNEIPQNKSNLAYKAAHLLCEQFAIKLGLRIYINKKIPVGAGLAGGSTDAAAVLLGINELFNLQISNQDLLELGLQIGSDVPFCILGGTAIARGRGEILTPMLPGPRLEMLLVKPPFQLSTAEIFRALRLEELSNCPDNAAFLEAWGRYDIIGITAQMKNDLEAVSIAKCPVILTIKNRLYQLGAFHSLMSGSGPSVVGFFHDRDAAVRAWQAIKDTYNESYLVTTYL